MPKQRVVRHEVIQPLDTSYRYIPLTQGLNAIVEATDFEWLSQWNWCAYLNRKSWYAMRRICRPKRKTIHMHSLILGCKNGEKSDHRNHDTLDNRRSNLRKCTPLQSARNRRKRCDNSSGFKGVGKRNKKWQAVITAKGENIYLGVFSSPEEAARAYDIAALRYHKNFAQLNFPLANQAG